MSHSYTRQKEPFNKRSNELDLNLKFDTILSDISKSIHLAFMFNFCIQDPGEGLRPTKIQFQSNLGKKNQEKPGRKSPDYLSQSLIFCSLYLCN